MEINTLECGSKQIILDHTDRYEVLFLDECGNDILDAFSDLGSHTVVAIGYEEGLREEKHRFSVKTKS
jgi:hypothetical protein